MLCEIALLRERFVAELASVGPFACVRPDMDLECRSIIKLLAAIAAAMLVNGLDHARHGSSRVKDPN